jgi:hypothetical protein
MDLIKIQSKQYQIATKAGELTLSQVKALTNLKRPDEFETDEGFEQYLAYIRLVLNICSGVSFKLLNRINPTMLVALFGMVADLITELDTFNWQEHDHVNTYLKYPKPVMMGGEPVYGHGVTAKTFADASDIVSHKSASLLGFLPFIYTGVDDVSAIELYQEGTLPYAVAIDFFKIHANIANTVHNRYPVLSEKPDKGETVKGYGAKGLLYEVAASGMASLKEVEGMNVLDFFDVLAYLRTVNKQIKQKYG